MHWMIEPFRRYADFSGRSRRIEFWMFILFQWLVYFGILAVAFGAGLTFAQLGGASTAATETAFGTGAIFCFVAIGIFWLATLVPNLAVAARRMQDQDIPGWVGVLLVLGGILLSFPYLIMAVFGFIAGTPGRNQYGPSPKDENVADTFV